LWPFRIESAITRHVVGMVSIRAVGYLEDEGSHACVSS
jgi:hypothetical protein